MKKALLFLFIMLCVTSINAQTIYESFESRKLNTTRNLKIRLPNNYDPESNLKYPVIIVFDGDYLFEPVVGQVAFQTYFDKMPESIVVGLVQGKERFYDSYHDEVTGLPIEFGARFYEFISTELIPHLDRTYKTSKFKPVIRAFEPIYWNSHSLSPDLKNCCNFLLIFCRKFQRFY